MTIVYCQNKKSLPHQAGAFASFYSMRQLGVFLPLVYHRVTPPPPRIKFADTHLYTWVERGTVSE